ncbi:MAG: hypothetical protein BJ554DRAFT_3414 [Olpidium bornovanus]|uniref:Uncharacterized protein n=1 Tax=Olpidium bornovanus TaxID=278681 RepID=A0A8H7ZNJ1_9FUNG|nr:MAG: hypothetical protein BJ554DRAFT_3414 [Olpidium bornovanus]
MSPKVTRSPPTSMDREHSALRQPNEGATAADAVARHATKCRAPLVMSSGGAEGQVSTTPLTSQLFEEAGCHMQTTRARPTVAEADRAVLLEARLEALSQEHEEEKNRNLRAVRTTAHAVESANLSSPAVAEQKRKTGLMARMTKTARAPTKK